MSFVFATPEALTAAASNVTNIGSTLSAANAAALAPTTAPLAAAADQVSMAVSAVLSGHGQAYQAISAQLATFHDQFCAGAQRRREFVCQRRGRQRQPARPRPGLAQRLVDIGDQVVGAFEPDGDANHIVSEPIAARPSGPIARCVVVAG